MSSRLWRSLSLVLLVAAVARGVGAEVLIAHPDITLDRIDQEAVRALFQGRKRALPNGQRVEIAVLDGGPVHARFLADHVRMTEAQFQTHWKKLVFIGQGRRPRSAASQADMVKLVAATKGLVGYIDESAPHEGVTVLTIIE